MPAEKNLIILKLLARAATGIGMLLFSGSAASPKQVCGWYAIAFCSPSQTEASTFANAGWGQVADTNKYKGFAPGQFCVVSGAQPKDSAQRDQTAAISNGVSASVYIKKACTDEANAGD